MKTFKILILSLLWLYLAMCVGFFYFQHTLLFFPSKEAYGMPEVDNLHELSIETQDGVTLNAWYIDNQSEKTILYLHGNGKNMSYPRVKERVGIFNELKVNALLVDYRGFGKSEGKIHQEEDLYMDVQAAYEYLIGQGKKPEDIVVRGKSLGGALAINLAQEKDLLGVIVECSFTSFPAAFKKRLRFLPLDLLIKFHIDSDQKIANVHAPLLIIHSPDDEVVNFSHAKKLFDLANSPKQFLETKGWHDSAFLDSYEMYVETVGEFMKPDQLPF